MPALTQYVRLARFLEWKDYRYDRPQVACIDQTGDLGQLYCILW